MLFVSYYKIGMQVVDTLIFLLLIFGWTRHDLTCWNPNYNVYRHSVL